MCNRKTQDDKKEIFSLFLHGYTHEYMHENTYMPPEPLRKFFLKPFVNITNSGSLQLLLEQPA